MKHEQARIGVLGAGAMGRGIAQVCAAVGHTVQVFDIAESALKNMVDALTRDLDGAVEKRRLSAEEAKVTLARVQPVHELQALADCDLVVEAVVENLDVKKKLFAELDGIVREDCILATNTSSLSVAAIAAGTSHPQRVVGWHFFNPVPRMKVVEVIGAPLTSPETVNSLVELSRQIGHNPVVTSDAPGFVVNHAGRAFVTEGLKLLAERTADHATLDQILRLCAGFRMGPFELLDLTGLDVSVPVMESIHSQYYGDDRYRPVALARTRLAAGLLGRKAGQGFYTYDGSARADGQTVPGEAVNVRIWWPVEGPLAPPKAITDLIGQDRYVHDAEQADASLVSPIETDLTTAVVTAGLDPTRTVAIDPLFSGAAGATLMVTPATQPEAVAAVQAALAATSVPGFVISDSPGYVVPRVVACIVNLACEMAQQGIAAPADIDMAVRLGLGYPRGPFEWGDRLGAAQVLRILENLQRTFNDPRYRPAPWLVRRARLGLSLSAPDRQ